MLNDILPFRVHDGRIAEVSVAIPPWSQLLSGSTTVDLRGVFVICSGFAPEEDLGSNPRSHPDILASSVHFADSFLKSPEATDNIEINFSRNENATAEELNANNEVPMEGVQALAKIIDRILGKLVIKASDVTVRILSPDAQRPELNKCDALDIRIPILQFSDTTPFPSDDLPSSSILPLERIKTCSFSQVCLSLLVMERLREFAGSIETTHGLNNSMMSTDSRDSRGDVRLGLGDWKVLQESLIFELRGNNVIKLRMSNDEDTAKKGTHPTGRGSLMETTTSLYKSAVENMGASTLGTEDVDAGLSTKLTLELWARDALGLVTGPELKILMDILSSIAPSQADLKPSVNRK